MKQIILLSGTTRVLHITIAIAMIGLIAMGIYMSETDTKALYGLHKSLGFITLVLALVRIAWRIKEGWPTALAMGSKIQLLMAKVVHWILIVATVLFPLSGVMSSIGSGRGLSVFGLQLVAKNIDPVTGKMTAVSKILGGIGHTLHELLPALVILAIVLHILGAIKHHVIDKDDTIKRMFSFK